MKKHMIMALLPLLFQSALYGADLNAMIKTELENARRVTNIRMIKLELDPVLHALVAHGKKSDANSVKAVNAIKDIKNALLQYRSEQYTANWYDITAYFKSNPEIVSKEIDPAITKVNNALQELQKNASIYNYANAAKLIGVVAAIGATVGVVAVAKSFSSDTRISFNPETLDNLINDAIKSSDGPNTNPAETEAFEASRKAENARKNTEGYAIQTTQAYIHKNPNAATKNAELAKESAELAKKAAELAKKAAPKNLPPKLNIHQPSKNFRDRHKRI